MECGVGGVWCGVGAVGSGWSVVWVECSLGGV